MEVKRRRPEPSGCVLRATLLLNGTASILLSVQRKNFLFCFYLKVLPSIYLAGLVKRQSSWRCLVCDISFIGYAFKLIKN